MIVCWKTTEYSLLHQQLCTLCLSVYPAICCSVLHIASQFAQYMPVWYVMMIVNVILEKTIQNSADITSCILPPSLLMSIDNIDIWPPVTFLNTTYRFIWHIFYLQCQELDEVMLSFFWWRLPVEVATSRYIILFLVVLMNFNLYVTFLDDKNSKYGTVDFWQQ